MGRQRERGQNWLHSFMMPKNWIKGFRLSVCNCISTLLLMPAEAMAHCYKEKWFIKLNKVYFSLFKNQQVLMYSGKNPKGDSPRDAGGCPNVAELTSYTSKYHIHNSPCLLF